MNDFEASGDRVPFLTLSFLSDLELQLYKRNMKGVPLKW